MAAAGAAAELCHKTDKTKAMPFAKAVDKLIRLMIKGNDHATVHDLLEKTMPKFRKVLDAHLRKAEVVTVSNE